MMRVIAGTAKGVPIKFPKGAPTRPATELVRGAIFSILTAMEADYSRVLDLFSGSGSLGIEALSRGAGWVDFVDRDRRACAIIGENLERAHLANRARIHCQDILLALANLSGQYGIVLIDPPYADSNIGMVITDLANSPLITQQSIVIITHSARLNLKTSYCSLVLRREIRHGDSVIAMYRKQTERQNL